MLLKKTILPPRAARPYHKVRVTFVVRATAAGGVRVVFEEPLRCMSQLLFAIGAGFYGSVAESINNKGRWDREKGRWAEETVRWAQ